MSAQIAAQTPAALSHALERSGLSLREVARRAGTSHATLSAYLHGKKTPSVATLARVVGACGFALDWSLAPRVSETNKASTAEQLEAVLKLAEAYPTRKRNKQPNFPRFPAKPRFGASPEG